MNPNTNISNYTNILVSLTYEQYIHIHILYECTRTHIHIYTSMHTHFPYIYLFLPNYVHTHATQNMPMNMYTFKDNKT